MYSVVLFMAISNGAEAPAAHVCNGGCTGVVAESCHGGGHARHHRERHHRGHGCHGCFGGAAYGGGWHGGCPRRRPALRPPRSAVTAPTRPATDRGGEHRAGCDTRARTCRGGTPP